MSDEKIRKMAKVPPVFVLKGDSSWLHAFPEEHRLLHLHFCSETDLHGNDRCCRISADCATPCRRSWEHCHSQLLNPKLGSACGKLTQGPGNSCFAHSCKKWQEALRSARSGMCVAVSECAEFLCPSCPAGARTWPNRAAFRNHMMSKHGWRNPWRQFVAGSCCPVCQKQFQTRARAVDHLVHLAERCRQAIQQDPDLFPKLETDIQKQIGPTGSTAAQNSSETGENLLTAFLPAVSCKPNCL